MILQLIRRTRALPIQNAQRPRCIGRNVSVNIEDGILQRTHSVPALIFLRYYPMAVWLRCECIIVSYISRHIFV